MNKIKNIFVVVFVTTALVVKGQNTDNVKKRGPEDNYSRSSMSFLLLDFENAKYSDKLKENIYKTSVPIKFDFNDIPQKHIKASSSVSKNDIIKLLSDNNYAINIMKYWWQIKDDGSYSTSVIQKRGLYNANDQDVNVVDASKVGRARLADAGLKLLGNSYVLVLEYNDIQTMKEIYDDKDNRAKALAKRNSTTFIPVKRTKNGFKGSLTAYLYKLNYSDTIQGYLDNSFIDGNKIDINRFNEIFSYVSTPYKFVTMETVEADGTQANPGELLAPSKQKNKDELMAQLVHKSINKAIGEIEKHLAAFRVKTPITNVKPIRAKIGEKEGITHERKFIVWEYVENRKKEVVAKRKGTIRARYVKNNTNDELGKTQESEFYQIGGSKLAEGMTLQERKDIGIGAGIGYGTLGLHLHLDINGGQFLNMPFKQLKAYGNVLINITNYENVEIPKELNISTMQKDYDYSEIKWSIGLLKEYPIGKGNVRAGVKLGYSNEIILWTQDEKHANYNEDRKSEKLTGKGMAWGLNFGVNLFTPSAHLIASLGGYHYFKTTYNSGLEKDKDIKIDEKLQDIFPNKKSINFAIILRINI